QRRTRSGRTSRPWRRSAFRPPSSCSSRPRTCCSRRFLRHARRTARARQTERAWIDAWSCLPPVQGELRLAEVGLSYLLVAPERLRVVGERDPPRLPELPPGRRGERHERAFL